MYFFGHSDASWDVRFALEETIKDLIESRRCGFLQTRGREAG